ncbi:putative homing endonuclease [Vibrio phage 275E43-1]|nr:putative homing endonuclease [Vibrio phage 275E43-1]
MWKHFKGKIPEGKVVDHINGIKTDNRLCNLRLLSVSENGAGVGRSRNDLPCGICKSSRGVYIVSFVRERKRYYLGQTKDLDKAKLLLEEGLASYKRIK